MTTQAIKEVVRETLSEYGIGISKAVEFKPTMKTIEVSRYLGRSRGWVLNNKDLFNAKVTNRRNDYRYDTDKVVEYKLNQL